MVLLAPQSERTINCHRTSGKPIIDLRDARTINNVKISKLDHYLDKMNRYKIIIPPKESSNQKRWASFLNFLADALVGESSGRQNQLMALILHPSNRLLSFTNAELSRYHNILYRKVLMSLLDMYLFTQCVCFLFWWVFFVPDKEERWQTKRDKQFWKILLIFLNIS